MFPRFRRPFINTNAYLFTPPAGQTEEQVLLWADELSVFSAFLFPISTNLKNIDISHLRNK